MQMNLPGALATQHLSWPLGLAYELQPRQTSRETQG